MNLWLHTDSSRSGPLPLTYPQVRSAPRDMLCRKAQPAPASGPIATKSGCWMRSLPDRLKQPLTPTLAVNLYEIALDDFDAVRQP